MTVEQAPIGRRTALRRLLGDASAGRRELRAVECDNQGFDGVLWRLLATEHGLLAAGDDGRLGTRRQDWHWQSLPAAHNLHAICEHGDSLYAVGWLGAIYQHEAGQAGWTLLQGGEDQSGSDNLPLFDLTRDSQQRLWAVGDYGRVLCMSDDDWREEDSGCSDNLRSVLALSDGRCLAAGLNGTLLVRDESGWSRIATDSAAALVSMAECADGSVVIAGGEYCVEQGGFRGRLLLYAEGDVTDITPAQPLPRLRRVRWLGEALWICGDEGLALRWRDGSLEHMPCSARIDLHDVTLYEDELWFCGDRGALLQLAEVTQQQRAERDNTARWELLSEGCMRGALRSVIRLDDSHLIAAGDAGRVLHIEDGNLRWEQTPAGLRVHALWSSSPRSIFAACDAGTLLHSDGERWETVHQGRADSALLAIRGFGAHDIFAVGDNGYALRYDGLGWKALETGVRQELYGLWGMDSEHLLAVGGGGLVLRWNGRAWKSFGTGTDRDLYGASGRGLNAIYLCGPGGKVVRFAEQQWSQPFTGTRSDLHALALHGDELYCVGSAGTVLRASGAGGDALRWESEDTPSDHTLLDVTVAAGSVWAVGALGTVMRRRLRQS